MGDQGLRILLVEDDEDDYRIVRDLLSEIEYQSVAIEWVRNFENAVQSLDEEWDAILTDYRLGAHTGLDLLQEVQGRGSPAPVIVLTGQGDREVDLKAMGAGAADYLVKGEITPALLERSLRYAAQQHDLLCQLRALSLTDELTGLYNRRGFQMLGEPQLRLAQRGGRQSLLLFIDIDGMKQINDRFGHQAGDEALLETAEVLRQAFRNTDVCARLGGDEFVVLSVDAPSSPVHVVKRLREGLEALNEAENRRYALSLSIGEVWCSPEDSRSLDDLLGRADAVMYEQKQNRYTG